MTWQDIHHLDQNITLEINSWSSAFTDPIWQFFSNIPVWIPMYVLIVGCLIWRLGWKKGLIMTLAAVATFGFCDQFSNFIKDLVCRIRPLNDAYMLENGLNVLEKASRSFSFFSAHSANSFGLATSTIIGFRLDRRLEYKGYATWMYFWAGMVALSRIFVGKHYLGDVIAGALIGVAAGLAFASVARLIIKKYITA
jgi:undecaprenyl-diphosphatase